jgi:hypothetical protein
MDNEQVHSRASLLQNPRIHAVALVVLLVLAFYIAAQTLSAFKEYRYIGSGVSATNTIQVTGEGEVFAVPDIATFTFSVIEENKVATEAQDAAATKMNQAITFLKGEGVDEKDIKTIGYNLYPQYKYETTVCSSSYCPPSGERELTGYEVRQTLSVKVRDTQRAGELLSGVGTYSAEVSGISFTIDDETALLAEARVQAIGDAQEKAEQLAEDLGVKLVRIVGFNESGASPYFAKYEMALDSAAAGRGGAVAPELPLGENQINSTVTIIYEIR